MRRERQARRPGRLPLEDWERRGETIILRGATFHRARRVLRAAVGDPLIGTDGEGNEYHFTVTEVGSESLSGALATLRQNAGEPQLAVTLGVAVPRGGRLEWVVQKAVELGVERIVPLLTERGVARPAAGEAGRTGRWRRIAAEAVAQCRRSRLPLVESPMALDAFLECRDAGLDLVLAPGAGAEPLGKVEAGSPRRVTAVVGPEGGLTEEECRRCREAGFRQVTVGPRILRVETAAIAALVLIQYRWGDLGEDCSGRAGVLESADTTEVT